MHPKYRSLTNSRGSRVQRRGRGSNVAVAGPKSRSRVQCRGRGKLFGVRGQPGVPFLSHLHNWILLLHLLSLFIVCRIIKYKLPDLHFSLARFTTDRI